MGSAKYYEEIAVLEHLKEQEDLEGLFKCEDEIWDKLRDQSCRDVDLPLGYQQNAGIGGCKLSLDQKKRLQIARAIVFKPKVLVIDDVILGLEDEEEEEDKVEKALENAMADKTAVFFTERANYAARICQKLIVLEFGKVVEEGSFDELKSKNGALSKLIINA